ncbi:MAG: CcoQ/FixQ family Cbb3-type cytochrome c oxidase assembly chaperone [Deltaproteobacteria bacterium]|nr:MAG: CcoQ/FixQ family Cbb3-type cytochrome c oxidase assembly chaperone [Deltaproteobacteria bacterium]
MDWASVFYLGFTLLLLVIFALIVARTYSRRHRDRGEEPKYRMLDDD